MILNYFFDFDKTLASTGSAALIATKEAFRLNNLSEPEDDVILDFMGIPADVSFPKMLEKELLPEEINKLVETYRNVYGKYEAKNTYLYDDVTKVLSTLQKEGKNLFVVSSKRHDILQRNLKNLGIEKYFKDIVGSDDVEHFKPAPDGIVLLLNKYQLNKNESVMIGDARYDLQMGKSANVQTCGAAWDTFNIKSLIKEEPDYLLNKVNDLLTI